VMKMADGGFRPAFNAQFVTATGGQVIVGLEVTDRGTDQGQLTPLVEQLRRRYGRAPAELLADGGYVDLDDIRAVARPEIGCKVYAPPPGAGDPTRAQRPLWRVDDALIAEWRTRMGTAAAKAIYRERAATSECVNALARQRGLRHFVVRLPDERVRSAIVDRVRAGGIAVEEADGGVLVRDPARNGLLLAVDRG